MPETRTIHRLRDNGPESTARRNNRAMWGFPHYQKKRGAGQPVLSLSHHHAKEYGTKKNENGDLTEHQQHNGGPKNQREKRRRERRSCAARIPNELRTACKTKDTQDCPDRECGVIAKQSQRQNEEHDCPRRVFVTSGDQAENPSALSNACVRLHEYGSGEKDGLRPSIEQNPEPAKREPPSPLQENKISKTKAISSAANSYGIASECSTSMKLLRLIAV